MEIKSWLESTITPLSTEVEAAFATLKFNTMGQVVMKSQPAKRALKLALQKLKADTGKDLMFPLAGKDHNIAYYDRVSKEESARQTQQSAVRRALLRAVPSLSQGDVVAERGSGLVWANRSVVAVVSKTGVLSWEEAALTNLAVTSAALKELMAEEAAKK